MLCLPEAQNLHNCTQSVSGQHQTHLVLENGQSGKERKTDRTNVMPAIKSHVANLTSSGQGGGGTPTLAWLFSLEEVSGKSTLSTHLFYLLKFWFVY
jgi:hypothetical protein